VLRTDHPVARPALGHGLLALLLPLALFGCGREVTFDVAERRRVVTEVEAAVRAFEAAQRTLNADEAIALLAPDFAMYTDGVKQTRDSVAAGIRRSFGSVRSLEPGFADVEVRPLSPARALATFRFRDSLVMPDGRTQRFAGATTLLWERRDGRWLMTYGHADHRPVP
jgi:ketosteroid isomerase-like protein